MEKTENQKKLLKILNEIFQLDRSDLDFGIYRIMNSKSKEINEFLENDLISSVKNAFISNDNSATQKELGELVQTLTNAGMNPDDSPKVQELKEKLSSTSNSTALENDVFSHLANFFRRYYKDGDFVSLRRYKKDTYAIPYEGEEVKLHWANSDQYYIKSGEYFRDYTFKVNDKIIHLRLSNAETEQNSNKASENKERRFVILEDTPCELIDNELYINFEYKAVGKVKQEKLNEEAVAKAHESITDMEFLTALSILAPTEKNKKRTIFEKHLKDYTSRNSFDYFIHKDLGGFLSRELDFYIKNEMVYLDDIMDSPLKYEEVMGKVKIFKEVSQKIIAFLTQLEELQKKLWEKKKFIIETNYCITLDRLDEVYYEQILTSKEQLKEWKELFDVEIKTIEDLKAEPYLVLDTKFFDTKFKYKLLSEFENLDEEIDGILINSENFGALNLLQNRYKEQVKTVYIDPPYNTGNDDGFVYMDNYAHSTWLTMLNCNIPLAHSLLNKNGVFYSSYGDKDEFFRESDKYLLLLNQIFGSENWLDTLIVAKSENGMGSKEGFATNHEYVYCYKKNHKEEAFWGLRPSKEYIDKFDKKDEYGLYKVDGLLRKKGEGARKEDSPGCFYPLYYKDGKVYLEEVENSSIVYPKLPDGGDGRWTWSKDYAVDKLYKLHAGKTGTIYIKDYLSNERREKPKSILRKSDYLTDKATNEIKDLFVDKIFSTPKPLNLLIDLIDNSTQPNQIILDYFAGSGTTGHATINLNREDEGKRKYILVEMGEYFHTATKPRVQKAIYSEEWLNGKPKLKESIKLKNLELSEKKAELLSKENDKKLEDKIKKLEKELEKLNLILSKDNPNKGISQLFKYFKVESYEDTLNNIEFKKTDEQQQTFDYYPQAKEDYMLNYSLEVESQASLLDIDAFNTPFDYKLNIATSSVGETKATNIDLVETFNYLLGLVVKRMEMLKNYLVIEGHNLNEEKILIIWRNGQSNEELNEFFSKMDWSVYDREFDTIYVNGDNNLDNLKKDEDHFKVKLIEQEFKRLMFNGKDN